MTMFPKVNLIDILDERAMRRVYYNIDRVFAGEIPRRVPYLCPVIAEGMDKDNTYLIYDAVRDSVIKHFDIPESHVKLATLWCQRLGITGVMIIKVFLDGKNNHIFRQYWATYMAFTNYKPFEDVLYSDLRIGGQYVGDDFTYTTTDELNRVLTGDQTFKAYEPNSYFRIRWLRDILADNEKETRNHED